MSKFSWSDIPRASLVGGGLALVVVAGLAWKMGVDFIAHQKSAPEAAAQAQGVASDKLTDTKTPIVVSGFRSANFGDDEATVRKAIEKDFGIPSDKVVVGGGSVEKTKLLAIRVKDVVPDSGIAEIVYILGYKSQALIQVNIVWGSQFSPEMSVQQIGTVASVLAQYFVSQGFDPKSVSVNQKLNNGAIRVFNGRDLQGHLVTLMFQEGELKIAAPDDKADKSDKADKKDKSDKDAAVATRKVAALRLSYVANPTEPDVFQIEKGKF